MESKQKKTLKKVNLRSTAKRNLAALLMLGLIGPMAGPAQADPFVASDFDSLKVGLSATQPDGVQLAPTSPGTEVSLTGTLPVAAGNSLNLNGYGLTQNGQKLSFGASGLTLQITDGSPDETTGSALNFSSFDATGSAYAGTVELAGLMTTFSDASGLTVKGMTLNLARDAASAGSSVTVLNGLTLSNGNLGAAGSTLAVGGTLTTDVNSQITLADASQVSAFNLDGKSGFTANLSGTSALYVTVDETKNTDLEGNPSYSVNDPATGSAVLGNASDANAKVNLSILGGSVFGVYASQADSTIGGRLTASLQDGDAITLNSEGSAAQSAMTVANATDLTAVSSAEMKVLNGSYASLGALTLHAASSTGTMTFTVDGSGTFAADDGLGGTTNQNYSSSLSLKSYAQDGDGKAVFNVQNGGALYVTEDLSLNQNTLLTKESGAEAGSLLSVGGTLTLNQDLVIGKTDANLNSVSGTHLVAANQAGTVNLTVKESVEAATEDGAEDTTINRAQFGSVTGAQTAGSTLNLNLTGGSSFGAFTSEEDANWTGKLVLGAENGGNVNLNLADGSTLVGGKSVSLTLQDGNSVSLDGKSQIYGGETTDMTLNGNTITVANGSLITSVKATSLTANSGTSSLGITGASTVNSEGTLYVGAKAGAAFNVTTSGTDAKNLSFLSSSGNFTIGGAGTTTINGGNYTVMGTLADMVIGDTADGTVNFNVTGVGSSDLSDTYVYVGDPNFNAETAGTEETGGHLTIGQHGTANVTINKSFIMGKNGIVIAENADADASVTINGGALQSLSDVIVGQGGEAEVTGSGTLAAGGKLVVGQKNGADASVNLSNSYVEAKGLVVGEEAESTGAFTLTGSGSTLHLVGSDETLTAAGNGTVLIDGVTSTDFSSCVYLDGAAQIVARNGITFKNSTINGYAGNLNATGDVTFQNSTYAMGLGLSGTANTIQVTDGSMTIKDGSKLEVYFKEEGSITGSEWTIAEIKSEDASDVITGEWSINSPLEIYTFAQQIIEDGKKQVLSMTLKNEYFNGRANTLQLARQSLWNVADDRISWNSDGEAYCGQKSPFFSYDQKASFWAKSGYRGTDVKGADGFNVDAYNLSVGVDCALEEYLAGGLFFNFSKPELTEDHESADASNYSFGLYGGYKTWGGFELKGLIAYTLSDYDLYRNMGTAGTASSTFRGSALTASMEVARPFVFGRMMVRPLFAVDTECVWQEDAVESGSYALYYEDSHDSWTYARLGGKLDYAPTDRFVLRGKAFYAIQLDDQGATQTNAQFLSSSETMRLVGADVGDDYFNFGLTAAFMWTENVSIFADYDGYFADESESHLVHGGFQINY